MNTSLNSSATVAPLQYDKATYEVVSFVLNNVFIPAIYIIGFVGDLICMWILMKQVKTNDGYLYQTAAIVNNFLGLLASIFFRIGNVWVNLVSNKGPESARSSRLIMGYMAHLSSPATTVFLLGDMFLTTAMCSDRIFALYTPIFYKNFNKRLAFYVVVPCTVVLSIGFTCPDFFRYYVELRDDGLYYVVLNDYVVNVSLVGKGFSYLRAVLRYLFITAILVLNICVMTKYKSLKSTNQFNNQQRWKSSDSALVVFLALHTAVLILGQLPLAIAYIVTYADPQWTSRSLLGMVTKDVVNTLGGLEWAVSFLLLIGLSKEFRKMMKKTMPYFGNKVSIVQTTT